MLTHPPAPKGSSEGLASAKTQPSPRPRDGGKKGQSPTPFCPNPSTLYLKHPIPGGSQQEQEPPLQGSQEKAQLHPPLGELATLGREDGRVVGKHTSSGHCAKTSPFEGKRQRKWKRGSSSQWHHKNLRKEALKGKECSWLPCSDNSSISSSRSSMSQLSSRATLALLTFGARSVCRLGADL